MLFMHALKSSVNFSSFIETNLVMLEALTCTLMIRYRRFLSG